jgi:secreted PhoX family phosphatase
MRTVLLILLLCASALTVRAQDSVTTLAGLAQTSGAVNGPGTNALFSNPAGIVADATGNLYVADSQNNVIRKITTNGVVSTFAGLFGVAGTANGIGTNAQFNSPSGLAFEPNGDLVVGDTGNCAIRQITPAGTVSTLAGTPGTIGFADGAAGSALFSSPLGIVVATNGTILVADADNQCIRALTGGTVSTFAGRPQIWGTTDGTGTNAQFNGPVGLALDARGNLFVSDANNDTIRQITTNGIVTTFAGLAGQDGSANGTVNSARFRSPAGLAFDQQGNLYVADSFNQTIRKISTNGLVTTASGTVGVSGLNDGLNGAGKFYNPYGLIVAANGSLLVADTYNQTIRVVLVPFQLAVQTAGNARTATISWAAVIGQTYQVQYQNTLTTAWSNLGAPLIATHLSLSIVDNPPGSLRVYRVLQP